jgi:formiminotetrahydrofolate cyclodeaminase
MENDRMEKLTEMTLGKFTEALSSSNPVPGGGGAAAMAGAMGAALGCMVCNLTVGKAKYLSVEEDIIAYLEKLEVFRHRMVDLVDEDAKAFEPLERCWAMPKNSPDRSDQLELALRAACSIPAEVISSSASIIELLEEVAEKGTKAAISDVGVAVELCKAAVLASKQNININASLMKDKAYALSLLCECEKAEVLLMPIAEKALAKVAERIG